MNPCGIFSSCLCYSKCFMSLLFEATSLSCRGRSCHQSLVLVKAACLLLSLLIETFLVLYVITIVKEEADKVTDDQVRYKSIN